MGKKSQIAYEEDNKEYEEAKVELKEPKALIKETETSFEESKTDCDSVQDQNLANPEIIAKDVSNQF